MIQLHRKVYQLIFQHLPMKGSFQCGFRGLSPAVAERYLVIFKNANEFQGSDFSAISPTSQTQRLAIQLFISEQYPTSATLSPSSEGEI
jgi:hypothetical protein